MAIIFHRQAKSKYRTYRHLLLGLMGFFAGTVLSQAPEDQSRALLNLSMGAFSEGYMAHAADEKIYAYTLAVRPKIGYHILGKFEVGLSSEILWQRGSSATGYGSEEGYGLGYYARMNFYNVKPLHWISEEFPLKNFVYLEWDHRLSNMYITKEKESEIGYLNAMNAHGFYPKGGLKMELYKELYVNLGIGWYQSLSPNAASMGKVRPSIAIEYFIYDKK